MKLTSLNLDDCLKAVEWRNQCMYALRTPYFLNDGLQRRFYFDVVCKPTNHRYWGITWEMGETITSTNENLVNAYDKLVGMGGITNIQWENRLGEISLIMNPEIKGKGEYAMFYLNVRSTKTPIAIAMIALALFSAYGLAQADNTDLSKAVFFVG